MMTFKNLTDKESIEKIKNLINSSDACVFTTSLTTMSLSDGNACTQQVDDEGTVWFKVKAAGALPSRTISNKKVKLFYSNKKKSQYLSIYGDAIIDIGQEDSEYSLASMTKSWFSGEVDNMITIQKVDPIEVHYWDDSSRGMVTLLKK